MQLHLPWTEPPAADAVVYVRHRRARRYILRVLGDGTVRVTLPRWGVKRDARAFVEASRDWIARERQRRHRDRPASEPWQHGTAVWLDGEQRPLRVERDGVRGRIWVGDVLVTGRAGAGEPRAHVEAWLRARAAEQLPRELLALAAKHAIEVTRVSVRNQRSRWGSCSPAGAITLNWRLIQVPPFVREYVLLHELMHRRELNHSRRFWRLLAACCPRLADAKAWLHREGRSLWRDCE